MAIHKERCPNFTRNKIQLSCDGVHENKSTNVSIDVYSLCFEKCKVIYPHKLIRPLGKPIIEKRRHLNEVVQDITANDLRIMQYIADKLKRSDAKECKGHASWFACDYCYAKGTKIDITDNSNAKNKLLRRKQVIEEEILDCEREGTPETLSRIPILSSLREEIEKNH